MFKKIAAALLWLWLLPALSAASSTVTTKIGSGTGSVSPGKAIIPTGGSLNFIIATANGVISYVTLDGMIVSVFRFGGIGRPSAIINIPENGKPRYLYVYFSSAGSAPGSQPGMEPISQ